MEAVTGDCIVELEKSVLIPDDAGAGEWRFIVEYQTVSQLTITAYDAFQVKSVESNMPISSEEAGEELPKPKRGKTYGILLIGMSVFVLLLLLLTIYIKTRHRSV